MVGEKEKQTEREKKEIERRWSERNPLNGEHVNIRPVGVWRGV